MKFINTVFTLAITDLNKIIGYMQPGPGATCHLLSPNDILLITFGAEFLNVPFFVSSLTFSDSFNY